MSYRSYDVFQGDNVVSSRVPPGGNLPAESTLPTAQEAVRAHELRRRFRLVRIVTLGFMLALILLIPAAFIPSPNVVTVLALFTAFIGAAIAYILNRQYLVSAAGYTLLGCMALAIAWEIVGKAFQQGGSDLVDLRLYDLFALPIVLSAVMVNRRGPIIIACFTSAFTVLSLIVLEKTPAMQLYWNQKYPVHGSAYDAVAVAVFIQILTATAAWLGADSMRRALQVALRTEELAAANGHIQAQRRRLQEGIAQIQQVHAAVSRGQWDARANITGGELMPVAISLNLLLDRLGRLTREQDQQARMMRATHDLAEALRRARMGGRYVPPGYTGTPIDEILVELYTLRSSTGGPVLGGHSTPSLASPNSLPGTPTAFPPNAAPQQSQYFENANREVSQWPEQWPEQRQPGQDEQNPSRPQWVGNTQ